VYRRITEQPHKLPLNAALLGYLLTAPTSVPAGSSANDASEQPAEDEFGRTSPVSPSRHRNSALGDDERRQAGSMSPEKEGAPSEKALSMGDEILKDLVRAFQGWLDARMWRNVRLCVSDDGPYSSSKAGG